MKSKLFEIKESLEKLRKDIDDYFNSITEERIVITKELFSKIKPVGKVNSYLYLFVFDEHIFFTLTYNGYPYSTMHYNKLMSGDLDRMVLNKKKTELKSSDYLINYELEPFEKTKLIDLYSKDSD